MKPVTLVVTDLDGTLLDSNKNVSEKNKEAIKELKKHGILFGIASGRPVESGIILCQKWGLADDISFLVGMNGGAIYDMRRREKEAWADMDGELLWKIIREYKTLNLPDLHFEVMVGNDRYVEWSSEETLANAELYGEKEIIVDLEEFLKGRRVDKLIIRSLPETQPTLAAKAKELNLEHCAAFPTSNILFEFVNPEINKGYGIQRVCEHYGLKLENIVAFGDEANDMQMLSLAGTGVAMQNAVPAVKHISDVVSDYTNDESALGHFIEDVIIPNSEGKLDF